MPWMNRVFDDYDDEREEVNVPRCKHCGSTDVRWRQQTGRWVLFALTPGVVHQCPVEDDFVEVGE